MPANNKYRLDNVNPIKTTGPGSKSAHAAKPAQSVHKKAIGKFISLHLFVLTG